jgi:DNA mismatch repair protein MutS
MVEMVETAYILNQATPRSLVVLDEIGRGTSTFDGISIAWAVAESLHGDGPRGPRTLFATHYHELAEIAQVRPRIFNVTMAVREHQEEIIFLRRVVEGSADRSYGIHVARLAGLPAPVLQRAREILFTLEEGRPGKRGPLERRMPVQQLPLFAPPPPAVIRALRDMDIDGMTPLDALNQLQALKRKALEESAC